jgi:hypothetical protein
MLTGMCAAQSFIAADYATNSTYAGGWSAGQNGGFGFTAWSTNGTSGSDVQMRMDNSSPFNPLGLAWTLFNPSGTDLASAGRGFAPLQVGQTFETVIDNPTETHFYRGYTIRLVSGTNNVTAGDASSVESVAAYTFEYFSYGNWLIGDGTGDHATSLYNTNTAPAGARLAITLTGANTYHLSLTPLDNAAEAYTWDGTLKNSGPVNWIEYDFYNTASDPTNSATDFFISSITIKPAPPPPKLSIKRVGANVQVDWPLGTLLEASDVTGPWTTNKAASPYTVAPTAAKQFYRAQVQ